MEPECHPTIVTNKAPPLNSDQLNYLIWRYLQEAGYGEAAVKLQQNWRLDADSLPFARHIKGHALVTLVQKGLRYHHLSLTVDENGRQTKTLDPSMYFFGPDSVRDDINSDQKEPLLKVPDPDRGVSPASTIATGITAPRAKTREPASNLPAESTPQPVKRGRKSAQTLAAERNGQTPRKVSDPAETASTNGHIIGHRDATSLSAGENAIEDGLPSMNGHNSDDRMDVDVDQPMSADTADVHMGEHLDESLPPLIPTLTNGINQAVQVTPPKVANLGPTSIVLSLEGTKSITATSWRPSDSGALMAKGENFCGIWNLHGLHLSADSVKPIMSDIFDASQHKMVTAAAWDPNGSMLAVATYSEQECQIHLLDGGDMTLVEELPASRRPVTVLKWNASGTRLVGSAIEDDANNGSRPASMILSWDLSGGPAPAPPLTLPVDSSVYTLECSTDANNTDIFAAGDGVVYCFRNESEATRIPWQSDENEDWTFLRAVQTSSAETTIIAASASTGSVWIPNRRIHKMRAHDGPNPGSHAVPITGLDVRRTGLDVHDMVEFATSGFDGLIRVWQLHHNATDFYCVRQLRMEQLAPIMCLSYSPDGFCLAGVSYNVARIWNAQHEYNLMANWQGSDAEWRGNSLKEDDMMSANGRSSINGDGGSNADHSLSWHVDSKKLAFGLGSQVAVFNFQR